MRYSHTYVRKLPSVLTVFPIRFVGLLEVFGDAGNERQLPAMCSNYHHYDLSRWLVLKLLLVSLRFCFYQLDKRRLIAQSMEHVAARIMTHEACTILFCPVLYDTVMYCTVLYCTVCCLLQKENPPSAGNYSWTMLHSEVYEK